ncbi:MAG: serine hydrolase domain-containing protein [Bacteroidota bacterium]
MTHSRRCTSLLVLLSLCCTSTGLSQDRSEGLIQRLEQYLDDHQIPGLMVSVVQADTVVYAGGVGYADLETCERVTAQHLFRQGSISKSFTALGLYALLKDTPYGLDSPLSEIDPTLPFTNAWEDTDPVRVVHLLEHTSGFEDFHLHAMYNTSDSTMPPTAHMVADHRQSLTSRWLPGTRKAYSNPNYVVAGHVIEHLAGAPFHHAVSAYVLAPLGMETAGFYFKEPTDRPFATGYQRRDGALHAIPFATINGSPAGDFSANANDMAAFLQRMLRKDHPLFDEADYDRIETPQTSLAAAQGLSYGYGLGLYAIWKQGYLFHGHGGQIDGFAARYVYSREADLGIALAMNRNGDANAVLDEILDHLIPSPMQASGARATFPIPDAIQAAFAGFYEFKSPKSNLLAFSDRMLAGLTLDFAGDAVVTRTLLGKAKDTLHYAGEGQFYLNNEGVPSVALIESVTGPPVLWINDQYTERASRARRLAIFFGLLGSFLLLFSFGVYSVGWLLVNRVRAAQTNPVNHLVLLGFGVCLVLMFVGFGFTMSAPATSKELTLSAGVMYGSSYALIVLSLLSVQRWFNLPARLGFRAFYVLTSMGTLAITVYLWQIGFIGLKLWSY